VRNECGQSHEFTNDGESRIGWYMEIGSDGVRCRGSTGRSVKGVFDPRSIFLHPSIRF
jgi:hypothetical protein